MAKKLELWGGIGTAAYLLLISGAVGFKFQEFQSLKLNELGDFLAGVFGPIAFLWLVLGFLQQGRELKLSSDALQLQAEELKNSVEQQKELVSVSREQVQAELDNMRNARDQRAKSIRPLFVVAGNGGSHSGLHHEMDFSVQNLGSTVTSVNFDFSDQFKFISQTKHLMEHKDIARFKVSFDGDGEGVGDKLAVTYLDADFTPGVCMFNISFPPGGGYPNFKVEQL
ncbi:hypothetical protein SRABI123_01400 [Pseudomonas sp. Bi123]|uniref:hypothetical protein n=1 Tax=Pseudomonas sp. Bi123 TaxID=2821121 RepID=UPI001D9ADA97|nr:hypothetical protein [Pseudomonas sp. Bi123]CAH0179461.1 hypothetical protein SRABI123_01400 [Pseudomonas sp. Bi123]